MGLERLGDQDQAAIDARAARMVAISSDAAARWNEPFRSGDHGDLLYDEAGLPR